MVVANQMAVRRMKDGRGTWYNYMYAFSTFPRIRYANSRLQVHVQNDIVLIAVEFGF